MRIVWLILTFLVCNHTGAKDVKDDIDDKIEKAIKKGKNDVEQVEEMDRQKQQEGVDKVNTDTANGQLLLFASPTDETKRLAKEASIQLAALKELISLNDIDTHRLRVDKHYLRVWKKKFRRYCPTTYNGASCDPNAYYRTADGTCNNLKNPTWGALLCPQHREIPPMYDDGVDAPRVRDRLGNPLPSARVISNKIHRVQGTSPRNENRTMMVMQWGQFIDHEFVATPVLKGEMGANIECCGEENEDRPQCFPIQIPEDDPYFNKTCMNFVRSAPVLNHDCSPDHREQLNQVTSFIDGSAIYGSNLNHTNMLRKMRGGFLRILPTTVTDSEGMLPKDSDDKCRLIADTDYCQNAGDARVNVVPSLGWIHTCFMREHNRIARRLGEINPHWDDETIFQQTRRIVGAIEQIINYNEYLPAILNENTMKRYKLKLKKKNFRKSYRERTNPTISNVFAAAAFRFGHSQIANYQAVMNKQYQFVEKMPIETTYHCPHMLINQDGMAIDGVARWLIDDPVPLADGLFEDGIRDKLFLDKDGNSLDLATSNIQRGRDHGIPSYNHWRLHCGLGKASMTDDGEFILPDHEENETNKLEQVYRHVDDIDLFTGAMTETHLPNSSVGPTFACLIGKQFKKLLMGDRYWHETPDRILRFSNGQLPELRKITFAKVICNNFKINKLQPNVFRVPGSGNERVECDNIPDIDLEKWKACEIPLADGRPNFRKKCSKTDKH